MNRDEFLQLLSKEGQSLLAQIDYSTKLDIVKTITTLRAQGHDPALIANALSQAKLRKRAEAKFGEFAERMFFTEDALEQASRLQVAALHANRFKQSGVTQVADLGCGIGADISVSSSSGSSTMSGDGGARSRSDSCISPPGRVAGSSSVSPGLPVMSPARSRISVHPSTLTAASAQDPARLATTTVTAGKINAFLTADPAVWRAYADNVA